MNTNRHVHSRLLATAAIAGILAPGYSVARDGALEEIIVTATRRAASIQDIPLNITALSGDLIDRERLSDLAAIAQRVPGMTVADQGPRSGNLLTVRGLSVDSLSAPESTVGNSGGGTVATYLGEIPLYIDLQLHDMERVEVLIGPQGTLYGAGTLGGAVRYIPHRPRADQTNFALRGDVYELRKARDLGYAAGATVNLPLVDDRLALRASLDYSDDPGFIDYDFLVREAGVSNPQPDFDDPAAVRANLRRKADVNTAETVSGRAALGYTGERVDGTLTYYYQDRDIGGRQINHRDAFGTGHYESAHRFEEPNERENELLSLELMAELGFAELTSATGYSQYSERGQRDQTDLLLSFGAGFELFPAFAAFTRDRQDEERFSQELRLVSSGEGALRWIVGGFYNDRELRQKNLEFTPGFDQFAVDNFGGVQLRPDALEYYQTVDDDLSERAVFGELSYQFSAAWQVTVGARWFRFEDDAVQGFDLPLANTVFGGAPPDAIEPMLQRNAVEDDDTIFKFNSSYYLTDHVMAFLTVSEGYRLGGLNPVPPCTDEAPGTEQQVCALPDEILIEADTTTNYELGVHAAFGDSLLLNASLYYIDWQDIQIADVTKNGAIPILANGGEARSTGVEVSTQWSISPQLSLRGTYAYTAAELTEDAPGLVGGRDAFDGDRLPGSPEHQGSLAANYHLRLRDGSRMEFDWSMTAVSDVITKVGERDFGETLAG